MKYLIIASVIFLSGCSFFRKIELVPVIEMPSPPEELMKPPQSLKPIAQPPSKVDLLEKAESTKPK